MRAVFIFSVLLFLVGIFAADGKKSGKSLPNSQIPAGTKPKGKDKVGKFMTPRERMKGKKAPKSKRKKGPKKDVIIPVKKEKMATKALRGLSILSESMSSGVNTALASATRVNRDIKSYFSSDFEVLLLKLTEPNDNRPRKTDVERLLATTQSFVRNLDLVSESNTYRVTLRKLWAKIAEADHRTVLKALYLLHILLKYSEPEDAVIYKNLLMKMSKEVSTKSKTKHFDVKRIRSKHKKAGRSGDSLNEDFVVKYAEYVTRRAKAFTSSFEEMKLIDYGMRTEDICAQLAKAHNLIETTLECRVGIENESEVVVTCLDIVARDLRELFHMYGRKLHWLMQEQEVGDVFEGWSDEEIDTLLQRLKKGYNDNYMKVQTFLAEVAESLQVQCGNYLFLRTPAELSRILQ